MARPAINARIDAAAVFARYARQLAGGWRRTHVVTAILALCLNAFVLKVQLFEKAPALKELAPAQSEPPFKVTQLTNLVLFNLLTIRAAIKFRDEQSRAH